MDQLIQRFMAPSVSFQKWKNNGVRTCVCGRTVINYKYAIIFFSSLIHRISKNQPKTKETTLEEDDFFFYHGRFSGECLKRLRFTGGG
jgi:hypothetical protein